MLHHGLYEQAINNRNSKGIHFGKSFEKMLREALTL